MKKIIKKIGILLFWIVFYFLFAGEMIFYPNVIPRLIANIIICIVIAWLLFEKEIRLIIYEIGTWIYKTNKNQKINDMNEVYNGFTKLLSICILFIVFKGIILFTTLVSIIKKSGILETVKLSCILIGVGILIPIVYYIEYQDKKSKSKKVIGF
jgi:hypothetical protein